MNGIGALVASDRGISLPALTAGLSTGIVSQILLPDNPVASAPGVIAALAAVFPPEDGTFSVGPIVEIGWGGQASILRAKLGLILTTSDPTLIIVGHANVQVPRIEGVPKYVDLNFDLLAVVRPDQALVRAALANSKLGGFTVSGDVALWLDWTGKPEFILSAGGFFPGTKAPQIGELKRIAIPLNPPATGVTLSATGYFALTTNMVQFGAQVDLKARRFGVTAEGQLGLDALLEWSPTLHFRIDVRASVSLAVIGKKVAGVAFKGSIEGATPYRLSGEASVSLLLWDISISLGPYQWGEAATPFATANALDEAQAALTDAEAWRAGRAVSPVARLLAPVGKDVVLEPFASMEVRQHRVPLNIKIDRIGPLAAPAKIELTAAKLGGAMTKFTPVQDQFAPGQFLNLNADQRLDRPAFEMMTSGAKLGASNMISASGEDAVELAIQYEVIEPAAKGGRATQVTGAWSADSTALLAALPVRPQMATMTHMAFRRVQARGSALILGA